MELLGYSLSFYCYGIATVLTLMISLVYAFRNQLMPYHLQALERSWLDLDLKSRFMFKMLLNGGGYYGLSTGLFMLVLLLIPFKDGQWWAGYTIGLVGLVSSLPLTYIVYQVKQKTSGKPPLQVMILVNTLLILGLILTILSK